MVRIATFNVENLFSRNKAFNTANWSLGEPVLSAYREVNALFSNATYSDDDKQRMLELLVALDIYYINSYSAVRRRRTEAPRWAWLRKNRGKFDRQPQDWTRDIAIVAGGRDDWIGWVELAKEPTDETGTRMTARVIQDVGADIFGVVEAEDRPSLVRFNEEMLEGLYEHVMLVDGNDTRGIDVGIMTRDGFEIESIRSNVDVKDDGDTVFSRDCPQYEVRTPNGTVVHILVNHFKSKSGGGYEKRLRQAQEVRSIVDGLVAQGHHVVVLGDLNDGPTVAGTQAESLSPLFENNSPLLDCYGLPGFEVGARQGTWNWCTLRNRFDYILLSRGLGPVFAGGGVLRKGLWGERVNPPTDWEVYPEITDATKQASDHAAVFVDLDI